MFFPTSIVFPLIPFILNVIVTVFAVYVLVYLLSIPQPNESTPGYMYALHFINAFGFLWLEGFIIAFGRMTLSGTFATWYWSLNKNYVPNLTIIRFMGINMR